MCGIAGVVGHLDREEAARALEHMVRAMRHRGPDDSGIESLSGLTGRCVLGATRLAIQDCSAAGHQPMRSRRTGNAIALNGEIYNVAELRDTLASRGHSFVGTSDTEVALAAFDEWGRSSIERLRGMFALCVWQAAEGVALVVRDRLGIKPLYYYEGTGWVCFASEVRALLASGVVPREVCIDGVASFLSLGAVREPDTIVKGVRCLPPGHWGSICSGRVDLQQYWSLAETFAAPPAVTNRDDAVVLIRQALEQAVGAHLVSDVPLGVFLSGGIDSSSLVGLVSRLAPEPPRTVSVVFEEQALSEERYVGAVTEKFETRHTQLLLNESAFLNRLPAAIAAMDQPTFDGVNTYVVAGAAREAELTVVLSGLGGDEIFGGYDSFTNVPRLDSLRKWLPTALGGPAGAVASIWAHGDRARKLARWLRDDEGLTAYELQRELFSPGTRADLYPSATYRPAPMATLDDSINEVSFAELDVYMRNVLLRDSDVLSMAHGLELRVPFLDHRLVELVAPLPGEWKMDGNTPKSLLVEAVQDLLPKAVYDRPKMGFALPFDDWLRKGLHSKVGSTFAADALTELGVGAGAASTVWESFLDNRTHWSRPWALYVLAEWCSANLLL